MFDPCCSEGQGMERECPGTIPNISRNTVQHLVQFKWGIDALLTCSTQQSRHWAGAQSSASQPLQASSQRIQGSCSLSSGLCTSLQIPLMHEQWLRRNLISLYIKLISMSNPVCFKKFSMQFCQHDASWSSRYNLACRNLCQLYMS